jgi:hypothetical protein
MHSINEDRELSSSPAKPTRDLKRARTRSHGSGARIMSDFKASRERKKQEELASRLADWRTAREKAFLEEMTKDLPRANGSQNTHGMGMLVKSVTGVQF